MRHLFCLFSLPLSLFAVMVNSLAAPSQSPSSRNQNLSSRVDASFYTTARLLVQQQINLLVCTEMALVEPYPNPMRVIRGQLLMQTKGVDRFLQQRGLNTQTRCNQQENFSSGV
ncbi:hypothetical protein RintRC_2973 [Richelia intracellularis]|nr:hypothetical protein RintRC_2973 [Richelia intracellularis]